MLLKFGDLIRLAEKFLIILTIFKPCVRCFIFFYQMIILQKLWKTFYLI